MPKKVPMPKPELDGVLHLSLLIWICCLHNPLALYNTTTSPSVISTMGVKMDASRVFHIEVCASVYHS